MNNLFIEQQKRSFTIQNLVAHIFAKPYPPYPAIIKTDNYNIHIIPGLLINTFIIESPRSCLLFDIGLKSDCDAIIKKLHMLAKPLHAIMLTHFHFDHIAGLEYFLYKCPAPLLVGIQTSKYLKHELTLSYPTFGHWTVHVSNWFKQGLPIPNILETATNLSSKQKSPKILNTPMLVISEEQNIPIPDFEEWTILMLNGHSPEDVCIYHQDLKVLLAGDLIANMSGGEWNPIFSNPQTFQETKQHLMTMDVDCVLPSHGPPIYPLNSWQSLKYY